MFTPTLIRNLTLSLFLAAAVAQAGPAPDSGYGWIQLFNGKNLDGWTPKFSGHPAGVNADDIFRVENGVLKVDYSNVPKWNGEFGHLYYDVPFSHYILRAEYRFVGEQPEGAPGWAFRNNGLMLHCQDPLSVELRQEFPTCLEFQLYGSLADTVRSVGNLFTPQSHVVYNGKLREPHGTMSMSQPIFGDVWVTAEAEVHGSDLIIHRVNGVEVIRYEKPQFHDGTIIDGGHIAIQAETAPTQFRKIEVLPLPGNRAVSHHGRSESSFMNHPPEGFRGLFDGESLDGWVVHPDSEGHWTATQGVIDYDARSGAENNDDRHIWTEEAYGDFELHVDWRIKRLEGLYRMYNIRPDGSPYTDGEGKIVRFERQNADSGILLRGEMKSQVNIWNWPVGSGEVWGYRTDRNMPAAVKAGVTPSARADKPIGEWNRYVITMKDERLSVVLNGVTVIENAELPGIPKRGPIGLQHHGGMTEDGFFDGASSLVQFRNIFIKEL